MKKNKYLLTFLLAFVTAVCLISCIDDKDEPKLSKANAKGILINFDTDALDIDNVYLWINEYGIYTYALGGKNELDLNTYYNMGHNYYSLSMEVVYDILSEIYVTEVDANTDLSNFYPSPTRLINYIKSNKSKYKYIACIHSRFILFNRTSNENYY